MPETPRGIQLKRVKDWRMPADTVKVTRPGPFGNPFSVATFGHEQAVALHRVWLETATAEELGYSGERAKTLNAMRAVVFKLLPTLRGKNLACWCPEKEPYERDRCHRAVLLEIANGRDRVTMPTHP